MNKRRVAITTDGSGNATYERGFQGTIRAIEVLVGDLTTPDIDISDGVYEVVILSVDGVAADTVYHPSGKLQTSAGADVSEDGSAAHALHSYHPAVLTGTLKVEITGGGANKRGTINVLYD